MMNILIVEDNPACILLLKEYLTGFDANIYLTTGISETLLFIQNSIEIDIVLLDIKLVDGVGYELVKPIKDRYKEVIVIAQTAYAMTGDRAKFLSAGFDDYISKPINLKLLKEKLMVHRVDL